MKRLNHANHLSMVTDYIPSREEDFHRWEQNFISLVNTNCEKWHIPSAELDFLNELQQTWKECYSVAGKALKETRTLVQVQEKVKARKILTGAIRFFVSRWVSKNPHLTDQERLVLKVTVRENTHMRPPVPVSKPVCLKIIRTDRLQLALDVRDENSRESRRLPDKVKEMEVWGQIDGEHESHSINNEGKTLNGYPGFIFLGGFTNHIARINFEENNMGSSFSFRLRWLNSRKEAGPWSDVYSTYIT